MTNVLIIGAGGKIAHHVMMSLLKDTDIQLTLYLRHASGLNNLKPNPARIVEGDVLDAKKLNEAMQGQDIVYVNLDGPLDRMAQNVLNAMKEVGTKRLIFINSLGIYDEVPGAFGKWNKRMLGQVLITYRKAADIIESSDLEYTIIRPAWLTNDDEIDYEITQKGEPFKGTEVSRKSVADLVVKLIKGPETEIGMNLGINKPGTEGPKPSFY